MRDRNGFRALLACVFALAATSAFAQAPPPSVELTAGARRLRYDYRFENDSSFDTPLLVPHFFEQRYERDGVELGLRATYRVGTRRMRTTVFFAPEGPGFGSDFDTFMQPDGDVATSGTAGDVRLASIGVSQSIGLMSRPRHDSNDTENKPGRFNLAVTFDWQRDRADFLPADRVVTHTLPPSETRELTTDRERTVSQTFAVGLEAAWRRSSSGKWDIEMMAEAAPALRARLLVQLPDKYPGRDIVFTAAGWSVSGRAQIARRVGGASIGVWVSAEKAGSYRSAARFSREVIAAGVVIGYAGRR